MCEVVKMSMATLHVTITRFLKRRVHREAMTGRSTRKRIGLVLKYAFDEADLRAFALRPIVRSLEVKISVCFTEQSACTVGSSVDE